MNPQDTTMTHKNLLKTDREVAPIGTVVGAAYLVLGKWAFANGHIGPDAYSIVAAIAGIIFLTVFISAAIALKHWITDYRDDAEGSE